MDSRAHGARAEVHTQESSSGHKACFPANRADMKSVFTWKRLYGFFMSPRCPHSHSTIQATENRKAQTKSQAVPTHLPLGVHLSGAQARWLL